ncbi:ComEC/Rec2 family competence protein [Isoptericola chiayiensis]|uniref:ComEC/Rec2 family competence protein n=1 Tax=Isoptericola chiayiensis TaxID=579446 RepID=A0ABP8YPH3_9MICO|nr:competence protein ComEC [Isoptericola chiayiensis]
MTVDLRLAPTVLAAWVGAWALTGAHGPAAGHVAAAATLLVLGAVVLGPRVGARPGHCPGHLSRARLRQLAAHTVLAGTCLAAVGASVHVQQAAREPLPALAEQGAVVTVVGTVASSDRPDTFGGRRWVLDAARVEHRGVTTPVRAHVAVTAPGPAPRFGASVALRARLAPPGIGAGVVAAADADDPVAEVAPPGATGRLTHRMRTALLEVTDPLSPQARGLVPGAAVGDTSRLPDPLDEAMRTTGLTHVTAVSGSHFAVVLAAATALCVAVRVPRAVRVVVLAAVAVGFVLLVRPEPSVLRAAWTCAVGLLALTLGRPTAGPAALATAATVLLVVDPWQARSFGFALSCAATAGIVLLTGPLARRLAPWCGRAGAFALAVPLAAQAACGPILVLLDPVVPTTAVVANLLAAPALVPATVLGLVATLLAPWAPVVAAAVAWTAGLATAWIAGVATFFAGLPGARMPWSEGVPGALLLAAVTGVALLLVLRRPPGDGWPADRAGAVLRRLRSPRGGARSRHRPGVRLLVVLLAPALATGAGLLVLRPGASDLPTDWQVVACDVGQGDTLVVRTGARSAVVVDVGPPGDAAATCLDRLGVEHVDVLVLSHFHTDHVGGLEPVLAGRTVAAALVSPRDEPAGPAARTRAVLSDAGVPVTVATPGSRAAAGTTQWQVLAAHDAGTPGGDTANDASVVLWLRTAAGLDVVTLGDLEEGGQRALLDALPASGLPAGDLDVVKMAHHGSADQSAALAHRLSPRLVLVPVGENDYGHPTRSALDLYAETGARVLRTDRCGAVAVVVRDGAPAATC